MAETALETQADEAQNAFEMLTGTQKCAIVVNGDGGISANDCLDRSVLHSKIFSVNTFALYLSFTDGEHRRSCS